MHRYVAFFFSLPILATPLFAQDSVIDQASEAVQEERVVTGTRRDSFEHVHYKETLANEEKKPPSEEEVPSEGVLKESLVQQPLPSRDSSLKNSQRSLFQNRAPASTNRSASAWPIPVDYFCYGGYHHFTTFFSEDLSFIELHDGSQWTIAFEDRYISSKWLSSERVAIYPNQDWFTLYDFVIYNMNRGESVRVNLGPLGPIVGGTYSIYLIAVDRYQRTLYLSDGSIWTVYSASDWAQVCEWIISDNVIIGLNNGYWSSQSHPAIIINTATTKFIRVQRK